jgi:AAA15 family ATPase/GTPase
VGIVDLKLEYRDDEPGLRLGRRQRPRVMVRHQSAADDAWLPFHEESHGTQTLFRMAPYLLHALQHGSLLVIDELEASLHPLLALQVVRLFNDPRTNPRNAQLVFTTHDTNLLGTELGEPALRRDQIWLTEKDEEGATCLYPLTDYKPRKAENLERGYLQGRYGAIPFLGPLARVAE